MVCVHADSAITCLPTLFMNWNGNYALYGEAWGRSSTNTAVVAAVLVHSRPLREYPFDCEWNDKVHDRVLVKVCSTHIYIYIYQNASSREVFVRAMWLKPRALHHERNFLLSHMRALRMEPGTLIHD